MSVEAHVIAAVVHEGVGGLRKVYQAGVSLQDFIECEEEFTWIEDRATRRLPISKRVFMRKFPDFEMLPVDERLQDMLPDLKNERAFTEINALLDTLGEELEVDNAVDKAQAARDILSQITRAHAPVSDHSLISGWRDHHDEQARIRKLRQAGEPPGIPTGLDWIDFHWDGLVDGRMIVVLGRPGEGKSFLTEKFAVHASFLKYRTLLFSPEMNRREHLCRMHTLLSAYPEVKKKLGLEHSFRNRALMRGIGYNPKTYKKFMEWMAEECGEIVLMTNTHRRTRMTPSFIEAKIADVAPDLVIIDPIYKLHASQLRKSRVEELSDISDAIQDMAEAFNIPVVVTNQAHRQQSGSREQAPHKDSSFNSDVPIQEADHVIGVRNMSEERRMILRCSKSRFGHDFAFEMRFHPNTGVMQEISEPTGSYTNGKDDDFEDDDLKEMVENATRPQKRNGKKKTAAKGA